MGKIDKSHRIEPQSKRNLHTVAKKKKKKKAYTRERHILRFKKQELCRHGNASIVMFNFS
ncbi:hypothetical protein ACKS23_07740 [Histoplasma ohiense]